MKKGETMSEETKQKIRDSKAGKGNGRLGFKHTSETKEKMRQAALGRDVSHLDWTGKTHTPEAREKISDANRRRFADKTNHPLYGKTFSEESKQKMRESHLGQVVSAETRAKLSELRRGEKHWNWQGGITPENRRYRSTAAWREWRTKVFERDDYTCQECDTRGGQLEPHHIVPVREDKDNLFTLTNGITLCRPCHQLTIWKESSFAEKYSAIVAAQGN